MPSVERKERKRMNKINRERRASRNAVDFGPQAKVCRRAPCCVCARKPADPAHVVARGMGGVNSSDAMCVPLCRRCHREQHDVGIETFQVRHNINLALVADELAAAIKSHECEAWADDVDGGLRRVCAICEAECEEPLP
jgi:5-methylcytosine-specific restriction endonuclease McrA